MQLVFLQSWFADETLKVLCWTLAHSLWQGALAAALAGIIILSTRKSAARLRYNLLCAVLVFFIAGVTLTFYRQTGTAGSIENNMTMPVDPGPGTPVSIANETAAVPAAGLIEGITVFLNTYADIFVLAWAVFFFVHCIKIAAGLAGVRRMRRFKSYAAEDWQIKLDHLSKTLGIRQSIRLLQSELVKVPVAIGFFKPVILVPLGLLTHLPPEQAETILLHELAHIRRRDYLVNLLQCVAEAIFFFNPALLWISSLIRQEREACCDDIVVAHTSRKGSYLEALVSFQEYSLTPSVYAMAIGTKQYYLLNRVKRLLTRENKKLNLMEKLLLLTGLASVMAFTFIPREEIIPVKKPVAITLQEPVKPNLPVQTPAAGITPAKPAKKEIRKNVPVHVSVPDTIPSPAGNNNYNELKFPDVSSSVNDDGATRSETTTVTDQNGKKYTVTKLNNRVTGLTIDGNKVPDNEIDNYASLFQKIDGAVHQSKKKEWQVKQKEWQVKNKEWQVKEKDKQEKQREKIEEQREKMEEQKEKQRERMEKQRERMDEQKEKQRERIEEQKERNKQVQEKNRKIQEKNKQQMQENNKKRADGNRDRRKGYRPDINLNQNSNVKDSVPVKVKNKQAIKVKIPDIHIDVKREFSFAQNGNRVNFNLNLQQDLKFKPLTISYSPTKPVPAALPSSRPGVIL